MYGSNNHLVFTILNHLDFIMTCTHDNDVRMVYLKELCEYAQDFGVQVLSTGPSFFSVLLACTSNVGDIKKPWKM